MSLQKPMQLIRENNRSLNIRHLRILPVIFGMLVCMSSAAQVQELYLKGTALMNQGEHAEARLLFEKVIDYDEDNQEALLRLAEIHQQAGNKPSALNYLDKLEKNAPGKGSYLKARIFALSGNAAEAVKYLEIHLNSEYRLPPSKILLDNAFSEIENSPEWRRLWSQNWYTADEELLQEILYLTGSAEYLQALEIIDAGLLEKGDWDALHASRGKVLHEMGQFQASIQSYNRAIEISSSQSDYFYGRAESYLALEKYKKAIEDLERAYRLKSENLELLMEIGLAYQKEGRFNKAIDYMDTYLGYYPSDTEARYLIGQIHFEAGQYLDALGQYNKCLKVETGDPRFFKARGKTYIKTKTLRYALNDLGMALDLDPEDEDLWYLKGQVRWSMNEREGAIRDWEHAARLGSFEAARMLEENTSR